MNVSHRFETEDVRRDRAPEVGIGATFDLGTDSYPCTIVLVPRANECVVVEDRHEIVSGSERTGDARYSYTPSDPEASLACARVEKLTFTRRRDGSWMLKGKNYGRLRIGVRRAHQDPNF